MNGVGLKGAIVGMLTLVLVAGCASAGKKPAPGARSAQRAPVPSVARRPARPVDFNDVRDSAPSSVPDVSNIPEPEPRDEPPSRYGNKSPYTVLGRTYRVMSEDAARGYRERGMASWYGTKFHGRMTSNQEPYDMYAYTGAHKTLPLPAYVRVRNLDNGRSLILRVNDRGPFHPGRIIDLSYAAAIKLGVHLTGTARVEVETVGPRGRARWSRNDSKRSVPESSVARVDAVRNSRAAPQSDSRAPREDGADLLNGARWWVQVGSFTSLDNAHRLRDRLRDAGLGPVAVEAPDGVNVLHRVRLGPESADARLVAIERRLRSLGLAGVRVRDR
ncbi:MAG: septal ring lytic transglycosylase RlpA family protein [Lysobacterales bacterium]